jgi:hypothetical protein
MSQILDDGRTIAFGQHLEEVEELFGCKAGDIPMRIARKGIDKSLKTDNLSLEFDSGKLKRIRFEGGYEFKNPPTPYPEPWKNFPSIGTTRISGGMIREDFLAYLKGWEERAKTMGAEPVEAGEEIVRAEPASERRKSASSPCSPSALLTLLRLVSQFLLWPSSLSDLLASSISALLEHWGRVLSFTNCYRIAATFSRSEALHAAVRVQLPRQPAFIERFSP